MSASRKITVQVPEALLEKAQAFTGQGVTQTVMAGLKRLAAIQSQQELLRLRGKLKFPLSYDDIKRDRE